MAAGLGFKTFTTGEVLTAADTNGYLMQGVLVFASAAARDAAITSPQEGQFAYLKDTNVTTYYTGSAWANLDTTGMTNPMTTTGDMVYSSSGSTPARLGIGTTGQVVTVAGGVPTWATPAGGGGKVLQVVTAAYGTAVINSTSTYADTGLTATITPATSGSRILVMVTHADSYRTGTASGLVLNIMRGGTEVWHNGASGDETNYAVGDTVIFSTAFSYLDSPATTSATTYKTQLKNSTAQASVRTNANSNAITSQIILMEIGA